MEDTPEITQVMINPQTQFHLYVFDGNEMHSPGMVAFSVHAVPYNFITEFYIVDMESLQNATLGRLWLHIMKIVPSTYYQLVQYLTLTVTTDIRGDQAMSRTISAIAKKEVWLETKGHKGSL